MAHELTELETAELIMQSVACRTRGRFTIFSVELGWGGTYYRALIDTVLLDLSGLAPKFTAIGGNMIAGGWSQAGAFVDFVVKS